MSKKSAIAVVNLAEFKGQLNKLKGAAHGAALMDAVEAGARVIETHAKINVEETFSDESTGGLAGSITVNLSGSDTHAEAEIGPTKVYGRIQELGGVIMPVHAKMLHWVKDGVHHFANVVHLKPRPYLRPAVDEHTPQILEAIKNALWRSIQKALGG